eukprot:PhF_6_TR41586/c0_g1_i1/m.63016/K20800/DPCD; protein DPCD
MNQSQGAPTPITQPVKRAVVANDRRRITTTNPDGSEMIEEYDVITDELLLRKVRQGKNALGRESPWVYEVGSEPKVFRPDTDTLREASTEPVLSRKDSADYFEWRVRNLPYPKETYDVSVDLEKQQIVVRTTNKKYFKRIDVPDLKRQGTPMVASNLAWDWKHNTLLVMYKKDKVVKEVEATNKKERLQMKPERPGEQEPQCAQQ